MHAYAALLVQSAVQNCTHCILRHTILASLCSWILKHMSESCMGASKVACKHSLAAQHSGAAESWKGTQERDAVPTDREWGNDSWGRAPASPSPAAPASVSGTICIRPCLSWHPIVTAVVLGGNSLNPGLVPSVPETRAVVRVIAPYNGATSVHALLCAI